MDQPAKSIDADDCAVTLIPGDSRLRLRGAFIPVHASVRRDDRRQSGSVGRSTADVMLTRRVTTAHYG